MTTRLLPALLGLLLLILLVRTIRQCSSANSLAKPITLAEIRAVAELVTLRVPMQRLVRVQLDGYLGGLTALLMAHGEAVLGADLEAARIDIDHAGRTVTVTLDPPRVLNCTLDHASTAVMHLGRRGLWLTLPGDADESVLLPRAYSEAQRQMTHAAAALPHLLAAKAQAERVLKRLVAGREWALSVTWKPP